MENELKLTFRIVSTNETGKSLEFLDVLHMIDNSNKFGFLQLVLLKKQLPKDCF